MQVNLQFSIEDENGDEFTVECYVDCDGQEPDSSCVDSDWDYTGWFEVESVQFVSIQNNESCQVDYTEITEDVKDRIAVMISGLAYDACVKQSKEY